MKMVLCSTVVERQGNPKCSSLTMMEIERKKMAYTEFTLIHHDLIQTNIRNH